jgi:hypothetical protein
VHDGGWNVRLRLTRRAPHARVLVAACRASAQTQPLEGDARKHTALIALEDRAKDLADLVGQDRERTRGADR